MLEYYTCRKGFFSLVRILIYAFVPCDPWFGSNGSLIKKKSQMYVDIRLDKIEVVDNLITSTIHSYH